MRIQVKLRLAEDVRQLCGKPGSMGKERNPVSKPGVVDSINAYCGSFSHSSTLTRSHTIEVAAVMIDRTCQNRNHAGKKAARQVAAEGRIIAFSIWLAV